MIKYTKYTLNKLEAIFNEIDFEIRYARGNFKSGYCILESRNIIVINKFYETEARINTLLDILFTLVVPEDKLSPKSLSFFKKIKKLHQPAVPDNAGDQEE